MVLNNEERLGSKELSLYDHQFGHCLYNIEVMDRPLLGAFTKGAIKEGNIFFGTKSLQTTLEKNSSSFSYFFFR